MKRLRCYVGLHDWGPDRERGFPYIVCDDCGAGSIYEPL